MWLLQLRLRATNHLQIQLLEVAIWIARLQSSMKLLLQMPLIIAVLWEIRTTCRQTRRAFKNLARFREPKEVLLVINYNIKINRLLKSSTWGNEARKEAPPNNLRDKASSNSFLPWTTTPQQPKAASISHKTVLSSLANKPIATAQPTNLPKRRSSWSQVMTSWSSTWHAWWLLSNQSRKICLKLNGYIRLRSSSNIPSGMDQMYVVLKTTSSGKGWRVVSLKWKREESVCCKACTRRSSRHSKRPPTIAWAPLEEDSARLDRFIKQSWSSFRKSTSFVKSRRMWSFKAFRPSNLRICCILRQRMWPMRWYRVWYGLIQAVEDQVHQETKSCSQVRNRGPVVLKLTLEVVAVEVHLDAKESWLIS